MNNIMLNTDSYKVSHWKQYPPGTEYTYFYIESRLKDDLTLFFGLQMFLQEYLAKPITQAMIDEADDFWTAHGLPFNREGWEYILSAHGGYLPVQINALPEGMLVETGNALVTVTNTDPQCYWLPGWLETALLRAVWYPTTIATRSWRIKQIIRKHMEETCDTLDGLPFKLHDFGARGVASLEQAGIGGVSHLVNFMGTDTAMGAVYARRYYGADMAGYSIPASEHSTITSWERNGEIDAYRNMIKQFAGEGKTYACVSDSYNVWDAVNVLWGTELIHDVEQCGGTLVIRPDSGDPITTPVKLLEMLCQRFGYETNSKGYKVLPDCVRLIQGDGIGEEDVDTILTLMQGKGLSADNIAFGMGGGLLQSVTRDTMKFAMKCSAICVNNEWRDVYKDPVTDRGKTSKRGIVEPCFDFSEFPPRKIETVSHPNICNNSTLFQRVYRDGRLLNRHSFDDVRRRSELTLGERFLHLNDKCVSVA